MRTNRFLTYNDERLTVTEWARKLGISHQTITRRLSLGWSVERALTEKVGRYVRSEDLSPFAKWLNHCEVEHQALERTVMRTMSEYIASCAKRHAAMVAELDMRTVGQPPDDAFKAPGVGVNFQQKPSDRLSSLPSKRG